MSGGLSCCVSMFARTVLVSFTGMFQYRLVMSKDVGRLGCLVISESGPLCFLC